MAFGIGEGAAIVGTGLGIYNAFRNKDADDKRQIKQQQKLTDMQAKANEDAANRSQERALDMWNKTNYGAQKAHMEAAGLNPALMYGMSGGGGATTSGAGSEQGVGSGQAANAAQTAQVDGQLGMQVGQAALIAAQVEATKAQAQKTEAETAKIEGVDTTLAGAQAGKIDIESQLAKIQLEVAGKTKDEQVMAIVGVGERAIADATMAQQKQVISEQTMEAEISRIKTESIGAMIDNEVKRSGVQVNEARIKEIANSIEQRWKDLQLQGKSIEQSKENTETIAEAMLWGAGIQATGNLVKGIVDIATKGKGSVTTTTRQDNRGNWSEQQQVIQPR